MGESNEGKGPSHLRVVGEGRRGEVGSPVGRDG